MSAGSVHLRASIVLASGFSVGALVLQDMRLLECAVGSLIGILVGPDLDVDAGNISNKIVRKRVGWFGERAWRFFWKGYSGSFKHGQFGSHFPVFSTVVRLLYAYFWLIFIPHSSVKLLGFFQWKLNVVLEWWFIIFFSPMFFYGLASSDLIHWALDKLTKEKKS